LTGNARRVPTVFSVIASKVPMRKHMVIIDGHPDSVFAGARAGE
jgi:hypothetical protein